MGKVSLPGVIGLIVYLRLCLLKEIEDITVPLKCKLPPSCETRRSSHETVRKTVSVCVNENFLKINLFTKTLVLQNVTLNNKVLGKNAFGSGVLLSLLVDIWEIVVNKHPHYCILFSVENNSQLSEIVHPKFHVF